MLRKILFTFLALAAAASAQSERGAITGPVTDTTGAVVAGASFEILNRATNAVVRVTPTTAGEYNAANLPYRSDDRLGAAARVLLATAPTTFCGRRE